MERRNGSLDVLRALAITMVVACHFYGHFAPGGPLARVFGLGGRGVDLFFVLSGWLLGHQLLTERRETGTIEVRRFWLRRAMRTLPAYFVVLALTMGQAVWRDGLGAIDWRYFVFLQNYLPKTPYFGISWSLCVEEHFYLAVGPVLLLAGRSRLAGWLAVALLAVPTVCRVMGWYVTPTMDETHVRYDQCAAGVLLAWLAVERPGAWAVARRWSGALAGAGGLAAGWVVVVGGFPWPPAIDVAAETLLWTVVFASWVLLGNSSAWWARVPNFWPTRFLADRAYSLYLVHIDAIRGVRWLGVELPLWADFVLVVVVALVAAEVLYRVVERPGIRARERFAWSRSRRHSQAPHEEVTRREVIPAATAPAGRAGR